MTRIERSAPPPSSPPAAPPPRVAQTDAGPDRVERHPGVDPVRERLRGRAQSYLPSLELPALDLKGLEAGFVTPFETNLTGARERVERTFGARIGADEKALLATLSERTELLDEAEFRTAHAAYAKKLGVEVDADAVAFVDGDRITTSRDDAHTLTHEAVHLAAHEDFTKFFGAAVNEGVTEYLTQRALDGDPEGRAVMSAAFVERRASYPEEVAVIDRAIDEGHIDRDLVERAFFTDDHVARAKLFVGLEKSGARIESQAAEDPAFVKLIHALGR